MFALTPKPASIVLSSPLPNNLSNQPIYSDMQTSPAITATADSDHAIALPLRFFFPFLSGIPFIIALSMRGFDTDGNIGKLNVAKPKASSSKLAVFGTNTRLPVLREKEPKSSNVNVLPSDNFSFNSSTNDFTICSASAHETFSVCEI